MRAFMTKAASVAVMTLCSLTGSLAYAAPPSLRDALPKEQRATFDEGSKLYREKRFVDAREAFLAVFAQAGDARTLRCARKPSDAMRKPSHPLSEVWRCRVRAPHQTS